MKCMCLLVILVVSSQFITIIESNKKDGETKSLASSSSSSKNTSIQAKRYSYDDSSMRQVGLKGRKSSDLLRRGKESVKMNKKRFTYNYYAHKLGSVYQREKFLKLGDGVKNKRYSETTDFRIRGGTDRHGRRKGYSHFRTYGKSNVYRGKNVFDTFDLFGNKYSKSNFRLKDSSKQDYNLQLSTLKANNHSEPYGVNSSSLSSIKKEG
ncbi:unnamed protein product [Heterobilharzia americana]|nr:unnamed protein product [Heterobilharzia americana]